MVNFKSPVQEVHDFNLVLKTLWDTTFGIYIWEYVTTLDYEWDVIRGRRPYRWTIWVLIYSLSRISTLLAVILNLLDFGVNTPINCQAWIVFELIFSYVGLNAASILIVFRMLIKVPSIAIWKKNKYIVGFTITVWLTNVAFVIQGKFFPLDPLPPLLDFWNLHNSVLGIVRLRSTWNPIVDSCIVTNTRDSTANMVVTFVSDIILLVITLVGLLNLRRESGGSFPLGRLLWTQGIIWLAIATAADASPSVFILLNLNDTFNLIFQFPSLVAMTIAATRMYRALSDFVFGGTDIFSEPSNSRRYVASPTRASRTDQPEPIQLNPIKVAVDVTRERHQMPQTNNSTDEQLDDKAHRPNFDSDLESAAE